MLIEVMSAGTAVCVFCIIYPYFIYPTILKYLIKEVAIEKSHSIDTKEDSLSLLFCLYNEIEALPEKIKNLSELRLRYPKLEILAYDDGSTDGSYEYLKKNAPYVKLLKGSGRKGKAHGMKKLAAIAKNDILVFTDANVILDLKALKNLCYYYKDDRIGGVCGSLHYTGIDQSPTAAAGGLYWRLEEKIKTLESSTGNVIGADGSIFSIRRRLYPAFPDTVLDDFTVSMSVIFQGFRLINTNSVIAHERIVTNTKDEIKRKVRIAARSFHTHQVLSQNLIKMKRLDRFKYVSHKYIRWFGGVFLILGTSLGFITLSMTIGLATVPLLISTTSLFIASIKFRIGIISTISEIIIAMIATSYGVSRAILGETITVWQPPKSR